MIVECTTCSVRGERCGDCAVTALLVPGSVDLALSLPSFPTELSLDAAEHSAVSMFVGAGLVNTRAVAGLRARRETEQRCGTVREVG
jgi:hypothetical protein